MKTVRISMIILWVLTLVLPSPSFAQKLSATDSPGQLRIAACQFPVSANIKENADWIMAQMKEAVDSGAMVVQFPECALSGYPGVDLKTMEDYDWKALREYSQEIATRARDLGIWVLLGSIHPMGEGIKPMNSLYLIGPDGLVTDRYDKRFCTKGDLKFFSAGGHFVTFEINEVTCGLLICFDVRFPELYREYSKLDVDVIFQSFYNARQKPGGIHPKIMPLTAQTRAATNHFYMSLTNSSAPSSWPCHFITPDGLIQNKLATDKPGILIADINLSDKYYDASRHYRDRAIEGHLSSKAPPSDPAYKQRKGF